MIEIKRTEETSEIINQRAGKTKMTISDVMVPVLVVIVLILLSAFVFIPMVKSAIDFRAQSKEINTKMATLTKLEKSLNSIDSTLLQADLVVAKKVIPNTLKVSDFIYYIDTLASSKNLISRELTASDIKVVTGGDRDNPDYTYGVNGPLAYTGSLNNILDFLDELQTASPYVVSIEDISIRAGNGDLWNVSFSITGYYIPDSKENFNLYSPFSPYNKYEDIMNILRQKAEKLPD